MSIQVQTGLTGYIDFVCVHRNDYYRLAYSFMGNEADSMDAISQMTVIVLEKYHTLRNPEAFASWSKKILVNVCRDKLKEKKRVQPIELPIDLAAAPMKDIENGVLVRETVAKLPPKYREAIVLRYFLGYEYKDIAAYLDVPEGTIKSRLNRGIATLRDLLKGVSFND